MADPLIVYMVSWEFPDGTEFAHSVQMRESQAKRIEEMLQKYVRSGYLRSGSVEEVGVPMTVKEILKVMSEEFPHQEKEWMP